MLQQTQIATVLGPKRYYERWLEQFPDVDTLAAAPEEAVLKAWEGLGYYSRARNLQRAARMVVEEHGGDFPRSAGEIRRLPGVGRYTAGAVASFAFDLPEPAVDANIARVLARLLDFRERIDDDTGQKQLWAWADALARAGEGGRIFNSALMELGQRICTPKAPSCALCPVEPFCRAENPEALPVKKARTKTVLVDEHAIYLERNGDLLLFHQREGRRRQGLWKLPERDRSEVGGLPQMLKMKYSITHYRVTLRVYRGDGVAPAAGEEWVPREKTESLPMASPYRKALGQLMEGGSAERTGVNVAGA